jgi:hypothetical protein
MQSGNIVTNVTSLRNDAERPRPGIESLHHVKGAVLVSEQG